MTKTTHKMVGNKLVTTTERELSQYEFYCEGCEKVHEMSMYCLAQLALGNSMTFTCPDSGAVKQLKPFKKE